MSNALMSWHSFKRQKSTSGWELNDDTIQYNTIQYNTIQYNTIQYNTIQYNTIQYSTIQYKTIQNNTIQCKNEYYYSGINPVEFRGHSMIMN